MKALVYQGPGQKALQDCPQPRIIEATDVIVKMRKTSICSTDVFILKGDITTCMPGRIVGHEGIGTVVEIGGAVNLYQVGDRVLISCITACGHCEYCRDAWYSRCRTGGWLLGNRIDGTQAEYVRIPYADTSLYPITADADEDAMVMLSDILPNSFECGVQAGKVRPGSTLAIVGAGPNGLAALLTAQLYAPSCIIVIDTDDHRLQTAQRMGAAAIINSADGRAVEHVKRLTGGGGVDTVIDTLAAQGVHPLCAEIICSGGVVVSVGAHCANPDPHPERLWLQNLTPASDLADTSSTPMLMNALMAGKIDLRGLVTHRFTLERITDAYDLLARADCEKALKVIISN